MADSDANVKPPAGAALLERLQSQMAGRLRADPALFRVVEVTRDSRGRLVRQGQIWHSDLEHVRRFGRAVAANSVSQQVMIADAAGGVIEQIPVATAGAAPVGWDAWRNLPLPPAPPRKKPPAALAKPSAPAKPPSPPKAAAADQVALAAAAAPAPEPEGDDVAIMLP